MLSLKNVLIKYGEKTLFLYKASSKLFDNKIFLFTYILSRADECMITF